MTPGKMATDLQIPRHTFPPFKRSVPPVPAPQLPAHSPSCANHRSPPKAERHPKPSHTKTQPHPISIHGPPMAHIISKNPPPSLTQPHSGPTHSHCGEWHLCRRFWPRQTFPKFLPKRMRWSVSEMQTFAGGGEGWNRRNLEWQNLVQQQWAMPAWGMTGTWFLLGGHCAAWDLGEKTQLWPTTTAMCTTKQRKENSRFGWAGFQLWRRGGGVDTTLWLDTPPSKKGSIDAPPPPKKIPPRLTPGPWR